MNYEEINYLVAEKVMGWKVVNKEYSSFNTGIGIGLPEQFEPSIETEDALRVFNKFVEWNCWIEVAYNPKNKTYRCLIGANYATKELKNVDVSAKTFSLSICLAALKAVGVDLEELE
ncbi:BC1872 family protein [Bacillus smithii]|uniref:BC1872 family protein n=1 Tax=Bacillus smithii TaxID=1479 RepID=UPI002E247009|nr:hypothetical protein [Bacillus smithii]MED4929157.1 hypothetical protein [Bacillus smithii]